MHEAAGLPSLILAGVPKAGTSSVFRWLADHPECRGSHEKETCFFADPGSHVFRPEFNSALGLDLYRRAFPPLQGRERILFEATPTYLYSRTALERIPALPSEPRCLFILREPSEQIHSLYRYFRDNWSYVPADMDFDHYLTTVRQGSHDFGGNELLRDALQNAHYSSWLKPWREQLGLERIRVVPFDDLKRDPRSFMVSLAKWIGINPTFYNDFDFFVENESYAPIYRPLQALNIALRGSIPKGRTYNLLRRLYRRVNTLPPERDAHDAARLSLRREFKDWNDRLARDFNIDLSGWAS